VPGAVNDEDTRKEVGNKTKELLAG